ncbi:PREDICTED: kunitz-type elastase inhibitor BrEI-like [Ipomoea nil]|uniref:kunitz-type elastase inhibitor BrEI-like n=1 Tax=Ipomoea nil TaxID=35883 RepID=UPI0009017D0F|nr:PREDICTED: kunitz-type elastase inhibitor BrEI-like [Ipomoea nil]XP_019184598.1 PREDICTED: kunitz-type elastase inhibitor BrEI-like [Ipomoea nil]
MKTAIILLVFSGIAISFLPLAISGLPPLIRLPTKADGTNAILDAAGNPVIAGAKYYAIPAVIGVDGGISVANSDTGNPSTCPTDVVINITLAGMQPPAVRRPLSFYPLKREGGDAVIISQYPLNVAFDSPDPSDPCAEENVWKLNYQAMIVTGGVIDKEDDIGNWFRIQKNINGRGYLFTWWPSLCLGCRIGYFRIGRVGNGYQLGINYNDESLYAFEFLKVDE